MMVLTTSKRSTTKLDRQRDNGTNDIVLASSIEVGDVIRTPISETSIFLCYNK